MDEFDLKMAERLACLEQQTKHREEQIDELITEFKEFKKEWNRAKGAWWMFVCLGGGLAAVINILIKLWRG
ncbi:MAG: hypothetical protein ACK5MJ_08835 [Alphaproteobacteria bacterium]